MLNALKSLFRQQPVAMVPEVTKEKLFKACRGILRVNGCKLLDPPDIGFKLRVDRSKLLGAGFGVFVQEGRIYKGDVVSLYSGTINRTLGAFSFCILIRRFFFFFNVYH